MEFKDFYLSEDKSKLIFKKSDEFDNIKPTIEHVEDVPLSNLLDFSAPFIFLEDLKFLKDKKIKPVKADGGIRVGGHYILKYKRLGMVEIYREDRPIFNGKLSSDELNTLLKYIK